MYFKSTINDVAAKANVSTATVSRVINNPQSVAKDTRDNVLKAIEELNFISKQSVKATKSNNTILVCCPDFENPFNGPVIEGMQKVAKAEGYNIFFIQDLSHRDGAPDYKEIVKNNGISGIIIFSCIPNAAYIEDLSLFCPVVTCSEFAGNTNVSAVSIDDTLAAEKAVNYLIATGCKKIGFFNYNSQFKFAQHREKGYLQALEKHNLKYNPKFSVSISSINYSEAYSTAIDVLSKEDRPDAIFACSDTYAIAIINAAKKLNIIVPNELSVIGFDNIYLSTISDPPITTIEQPMSELGRKAFELLLERIRNPKSVTRHIILDTELIVRKSTKF